MGIIKYHTKVEQLA